MKIIIIGCSGAGKSVLTRRINEFLDYPVMHLDKVYHTVGKEHISREELIEKVNEFASTHNKWIIDGNYISILEMRVRLADTVIVLNIPSKICLENIYKRSEESLRNGANTDDMASDFDETITQEFVEFISNFEKDTFPRIKEILEKYSDKTIKILNSYEEVEAYVNDLKSEILSFPFDFK